MKDKKPAASRIYIVAEDTQGHIDLHLVEAKSPEQAIRKLVEVRFRCEVATATTVAQMMGRGAKVISALPPKQYKLPIEPSPRLAAELEENS